LNNDQCSRLLGDGGRPYNRIPYIAVLALEAIGTIKRGHIYHKQSGVQGEILFINQLFDAA